MFVALLASKRPTIVSIGPYYLQSKIILEYVVICSKPYYQYIYINVKCCVCLN